MAKIKAWLASTLRWLALKVHTPSAWTTLGGLVAGVLSVLNQEFVRSSSAWHSAITVALVFLSGIGISPLVGAKFRAALHLTTRVSVVIASGLAAATVAVTTIRMDGTVKTIIAGVLVFAAALGFAPASTQQLEREWKQALLRRAHLDGRR